MIPLFAFLLVQEMRVPAFAVYCTACATDILDGYLARKNNQITQFGRYMDPLADKLIQLTAIVILGLKNNIPMVVPYIALAKEGLMIAGGIIMYKKLNFKIVSNWFGKLATTLFFITILLGIFKSGIADWVAILAVASSLYAFIRYLLTYLDMMGKTVK
jgi:cardiolipin synthase